MKKTTKRVAKKMLKSDEDVALALTRRAPSKKQNFLVRLAYRPVATDNQFDTEGEFTENEIYRILAQASYRFGIFIEKVEKTK